MYAAGAVGSDLLCGILAAGLAQAVRFGTDVVEPEMLALGLFPVLWVLIVFLGHGYKRDRLGIGNEEFCSLFRAGLVGLAAIAFLSYTAALNPSRALVVIAVPTAALTSVVGRHVLRRRLHHLRAGGRCLRTVVAIGRERAVVELIRQLRRERHCGMEVVAACVPDPLRASRLQAENVRVIGDLTQAARAARDIGADAVVVTSASKKPATYLRRLSWDLEGSGVELLVAPGLTEVAGPRMHMRPFIGLPLLHVEEPTYAGPKQLLKNLLDRVTAGIVVVALLPVSIAVVIAIRLDSPGPALFRQQRIGQAGRPFSLLKFRTMHIDAEARRGELLQQNQNADGLLFKVLDDPRVTRVGRVLRRFSLDELPQLLNILTGQMSLVGPRPSLPGEVARYEDPVPRRLLVKPGLTGLWQVSGRSDLPWEEAVRLDLRYVENWSLSLDLLILWKTCSAVVLGRGAY
jgi:exopolysaccharide biosynthesis polyprenyl glycosylphosphotransferase